MCACLLFCVLMYCDVRNRNASVLLTDYGVWCRQRAGRLIPLSRLLQRRRRHRTRLEGSRSTAHWTNTGRLRRTVSTDRLSVLWAAARQTMFLRRQLRHPRCKHQSVSAFSEHTFKLKFHWDQFPRNFLADLLATSPDHLDMSRWSGSRQLPRNFP